MPQTREHVPGPPGWRPVHPRCPEQVRHGRDEDHRARRDGGPRAAGRAGLDEEAPIVHISALGALEGEQKWADSILELADALDSYIPEPERDLDKPFLMPVEDIFTITGRGTVVTGRVERGQLNLNDEIEIIGIREKSTKTTVTSIEMFNKLLDTAEAGDNAALLLRGLKREDVERGQVIAKPGATHTEFEGSVYILSRMRAAATPALRVPPAVLLPHHRRHRRREAGGTEMVMPGDNVDMSVTLISRSPWTRACGSPSVRVAAPSAPAVSPRSTAS